MSKDSGENLSRPADVQNSLRDRIAKAIQESLMTEIRVRGQFISVYWDHDDEGEKVEPALVRIDGTVTPERVADAVIAALELPPTWGVPSFDNGDPIDSDRAK